MAEETSQTSGNRVGATSQPNVLSEPNFVSERSWRRRSKALKLNKLINDVMTKKVITVDSETPIQTASILLLENNISCLPVVDAEYMIEGILSWKDILHYYIYNT